MRGADHLRGTRVVVRSYRAALRRVRRPVRRASSATPDRAVPTARGTRRSPPGWSISYSLDAGVPVSPVREPRSVTPG